MHLCIIHTHVPVRGLYNLTEVAIMSPRTVYVFFIDMGGK